MWLVSRTELVDNYCWEGEGIWSTKYRMGNSIPLIGLECTPGAGGAMSTYEAYCKNPDINQTSRSVNDLDEKGFREKMCIVTTVAKGLTITCAISSVAAIGFGLYAHVSAFERAKLISAAGGTLSSLLGSLCSGILLLVMNTSPLFSSDHYKDLGEDFLIPYKGISCVLEIPIPILARSLHLNGPARCLFPGPSFALAFSCFVGGLLGLLLFALKWHEIVAHVKLGRVLARREGEPGSGYSGDGGGDEIVWMLRSPGFGLGHGSLLSLIHI